MQMQRSNLMKLNLKSLRFKPAVLGLPFIVGLALLVNACETPETEIETPDGETEIENPSEAPAVSPAPTTAPTSPTSPTAP
jgi:hypothetical protein